MTADEFKDIRVKLGLLQEDLAVWLGVSAATVSRMESGVSPVSGPVSRCMRLLWESGGQLFSRKPPD